jgi:hypothetical protein
VYRRALKLNDEEWYEYFNSIARNCARVLATVALPPDGSNGWAVGVQRSLHGIRYDSDADLIEVAVGYAAPARVALRYFVSAPRSITVEEFDHTKLIFVDDASRECTVIRLSYLAWGPEPGISRMRDQPSWRGSAYELTDGRVTVP